MPANITAPRREDVELGWAIQQADETLKQRQRLTPAFTAVALDHVQTLVDQAAVDAEKPPIFCGDCGLIFKYQTEGMAKMQRSRHQRKHRATV